MRTFTARSQAGSHLVEATLHVPAEDAFWNILEVRSNMDPPLTYIVSRTAPKFSVLPVVRGVVVEDYSPEEAYVNAIAYRMAIRYLKREKPEPLFGVLGQWKTDRPISTWDIEHKVSRNEPKVQSRSGKDITEEKVARNVLSYLPFLRDSRGWSPNGELGSAAILIPDPFLDPAELSGGEVNSLYAYNPAFLEPEALAHIADAGLVGIRFSRSTEVTCESGPSEGLSPRLSPVLWGRPVAANRRVRNATFYLDASEIMDYAKRGRRGLIDVLKQLQAHLFDSFYHAYLFPSFLLGRALSKDEIADTARAIVALQSNDIKERLRGARHLYEQSNGLLPLRMDLAFILDYMREERIGESGRKWRNFARLRLRIWGLADCAEGEVFAKLARAVAELSTPSDSDSSDWRKKLSIESIDAESSAKTALTRRALCGIAPLYDDLHRGLLLCKPLLATLPEGCLPRVFVRRGLQVPMDQYDGNSPAKRISKMAYLERWIDLGPIDLRDERSASLFLQSCRRAFKVDMPGEPGGGRSSGTVKVLIGYPVILFPYRDYKEHFAYREELVSTPVVRVHCNFGVAHALYEDSCKPEKKVLAVDGLRENVEDLAQRVGGRRVEPLRVTDKDLPSISDYSIGWNPPVEELGPPIRLKKDARAALLRSLGEVKDDWEKASLKLSRAFSYK